MTGLSARLGSSRFSMAAKKASQSTWAMASVSRSGWLSTHGEPHAGQRETAPSSWASRQSRQTSGAMSVRLAGSGEEAARLGDGLGTGSHLVRQADEQVLVSGNVVQHRLEE